MLTRNPTRPALGYPEPIHRHHNGAVTTIRGHHVPSANSFNIALSNSASANSFFNLAFATWSSLSCFAPFVFIPPYWFGYRFHVDSAISR